MKTKRKVLAQEFDAKWVINEVKIRINIQINNF